MYQEIINRMDNKTEEEKNESFIFNYLEGYFYYAQEGNNTYFRNTDYIREIIEEMVIEAGMGAMFIVPE